MTNDLPVQTLLVSTLTTAALALLCVVAASWFWLWLAPAPEAPAAVASPTALVLEAAYGVFGGGRGDSLGGGPAGAAVNDGAVPAATGLAIRLLGIVAAEGDGEDYAVVELEPGTIIAIRAGEEFAPGIHLTEVGTDHLVLERGGVRETLTWPQP